MICFGLPIRLMPNQTHYWVDRFDPVLLHLHGDFGIRYYGVAYLLAFVIGWLLLRAYYRAGKSPLSPPQIDQAMFAIILGVLVGGRLGYMLLYDWTGWIHAPRIVFQVWDGGMASHGGFIGVALALVWISRKFAVPFLKLGDLLVSITPPGLLLGRVANFVNGELWGRVSTVPWAVIFPKSAHPGTPLNLIPPRHPSQIYEALLEGAALLVYTQWRLWRTPALNTPGQLSGEFLIGYAVVRIICEQFRQPDASLILGMSRGIFYSIFLLVAGVLLVLFVNRHKTRNESGPGNP
jgi:phosphatidylglycerol:prolipoprotein diacylglycerol transferase